MVDKLALDGGMVGAGEARLKINEIIDDAGGDGASFGGGGRPVPWGGMGTNYGVSGVNGSVVPISWSSPTTESSPLQGDATISGWDIPVTVTADSVIYLMAFTPERSHAGPIKCSTAMPYPFNTNYVLTGLEDEDQDRPSYFFDEELLPYSIARKGADRQDATYIFAWWQVDTQKLYLKGVDTWGGYNFGPMGHHTAIPMHMLIFP